jgi:hypothetical protein
MKGVYWGVTLLLASVFIRFVAGGDLRFAKEGIFLFSALVSTWAFGIEAVPKKFAIPFFIIFLLTFFNQFNSYNTAVYTQSIMVVSSFIIFASARDMSEDEEIQLEWFLLACFLLHTSWIFLNYFGHDYWDIFGIPRITVDGNRNLIGNTMLIGAMHQPSMSGAAIMALLPFSWLFFPFGLLAIGMLHGSMCLFSLGVAFLWLVARLRNIWWAIMAFVGGIPFAFLFLYKYPDYLKPGGRLGAWRAWILWPTDWFHRVFGWGTGYIYAVFGPKVIINNEAFKQLHNEFMEIHAAWGLVGLAVTFYLFKQIKDFDSKYFYSFLMLWVNSLGNLTFHLSFTSLIMILCYAKIINKKGDPIYA